MAITSREFEPPIVVRWQKSVHNNIRLRVDFLCSDGEVCIPFTIGEDELMDHQEGWKVRLNMTTEKLKQTLLRSLQTQVAREMLDA